MINNEIIKPIEILYVEDNPGDFRLVQLILPKENADQILLENANSLSTGLECLAHGKFDLVLLDLGLPDSDGLDTFRKLKASAVDIPLIVLTGLDDETVGLQAINEGAQDYLIKGKITGEILVRAIKYAMWRKSAEREIRDGEKRYRAIFENTGTATVIVEEDSFISLANAEFEKLTGYPKEELEGKKRWIEFVVEDDLERMMAQHRLRREDPDAALKSYEFRLVDRNGHIKDILLTIDIIPGTKKSVASLLDITERKRAEEREKHLNTVIKAIRNVNQLIVKEKDRLRLIKCSCKNLVETRGYHFAWITLFDDGMPSTFASIGSEEIFQELRSSLNQGVLPECIRRALASPGAQVVHSESDECGSCPLASAYPDLAHMAVQLTIDGRVLGVLAVSVPEVFSDDFEERSLLAELAGDIAYALHGIEMEKERERVEARIQRINRALRVISACNRKLVIATREIDWLNELCHVLVDDAGFRMAWVGYAEADEKKSVRPVANAGFEEGYLDTINISWADVKSGQGPTGTAIRTGQPVIARNIPTDPAFEPWRQAAIQRGYTSSIALPLIANGATLGALNVYAREADAFDAEEVELLVQLAWDLAYGISSLRIRREKEQALLALRESERRLADIINFLPDATFVIDNNGEVVAWNHSMEEMTGIKGQDILGKGDYEYALPFYGEKRPMMIDLVLEPHPEIERMYHELKWVDRTLVGYTFTPNLKGVGAYVWGVSSPIYNSQGMIEGAIESLRDITGRKQDEDRIKASLQEKEVLLKEIHHRVKNNLQIISALLSLQSSYLTDEDIIKVFRDSQNRIKSMALVHENLYRSKDFDKIDFNEYINQLVTHLYQSYGDLAGKIKIKAHSENVSLNINTAIPCGMIINELISNSFKHAFPDGRGGEICVDLSSKDDGFRLVVGDNGIGIKGDINIEQSKTLGFRLIDTLVKQIHGMMSFDTSDGTRCEINFEGLG